MVQTRTQIGALLKGSFLRFFLASLFGLAIDIALASALHYLAGFSLVAASASALVMAAVIMYFVHEFWTFRSATSAVSGSRLSGVLLSSLAALFVRSSFLMVAGQLLSLGERFAIVQLVAATGLSFTVNYLLVRRVIAGRKSTSSD